MKTFFCLAALAAPLIGALPAAAEQPPGVYVILDGSGSMWGQLPDGTHKITAARDVLSRFTAGDFAGRELAFRVYGHRREGDCADTELVVPFSPPEAAVEEMARFARGVNPKGKTPISRSLRAALEDFGDRPGEIILISDGIETCDEDPCALVRAWNERNVAVRVHVVGLGLEEKERLAMQCISDAAGTTYQDAQSADELAAGLGRIQQAEGEPGEPPSSHWQVLDIVAATAAGEPMRVKGHAVGAGGERLAVSSGGHNRVPPGEHEVTVGVETWNGNLYEPVTQRVTVGAEGATEIRFVVVEPPSVRARFRENGEETGGSFVEAYQDGERVLGFRPKDRAYVDPGAYEFRASPNADNVLSVRESFAAGEHKEIVFELTPTVLAIIKMVAAGSGLDFRTNYELWQGGEKKYRVHWANGVRALPGTYDLRLPLQLTPWVHQGLVLTTEPQQEYRIEVPVGHLTVVYEKADGSRERDERCFLERSEGEKWVSDGVSRTGEPIALVPGRYRLRGWDRMGTFDEVVLEIAVGEEKEIALRDKGGS